MDSVKRSTASVTPSSKRPPQSFASLAFFVEGSVADVFMVEEEVHHTCLLLCLKATEFLGLGVVFIERPDGGDCSWTVEEEASDSICDGEGWPLHSVLWAVPTIEKGIWHINGFGFGLGRIHLGYILSSIWPNAQPKVTPSGPRLLGPFLPFRNPFFFYKINI